MIISLSVLATRIATLALVHTGMSKETAKFQARSAFMGVGFTTKESEMVVNHPVRRKILTFLIFLGNAGIITTVSTAIFSFISMEGSGFFSLEVVVLISGLLLLIFLSRSKWIDRKLSVIINKALQRYTRLDVRDYYNLLHLEGDYMVQEIKAEESHWITGKSLQNLQLDKEGLLVLGIKRANGEYTGAPTGTTEVKEGDIAIIYGHSSLLDSLGKRQEGEEGNQQHEDASKAQSEAERKEKANQENYSS